MELHFESSPTSSLGIELELGLVDLDTGALACRATEVLKHLEEDGVHPKLKHELYECTIEVITGVCGTVDEARRDLIASINELRTVTDPAGLGLISMGMHPFSRWKELTKSPGERYEWIVNRIGWPVHRLTTTGLHVHVGVRSAEKSIAITNALGVYLPVFLALSASSPYRQGFDTGLASVRAKIFEALPGSGLPPVLEDWTAFTELMELMINAGSIETVRELWWDIRPHPGFGTVELRMCDAPSTMWEIAALAALAQCLVQHFDDLIDAGDPLPTAHEWIRKENKWRAVRWGADAELVVDDTGQTRPLTEVSAELVSTLMPVAKRLGCVDELASLDRIVTEGPSYQRQRAIVDAGGNLIDVVERNRLEFLAGLQ